jgi:hypothetical protein
MKLCHAAALAIVGRYLMAPPTTMAMECEKDSLSDVSGSGAILEMLSGQIYKVDDVDQVDSALWLSAEDVLVCTETKTIQGKRITIYKIINKESNGEEVSASRVK